LQPLFPDLTSVSGIRNQFATQKIDNCVASSEQPTMPDAIASVVATLRLKTQLICLFSKHHLRRHQIYV
jgi:hypothetical protein